jgi:hypothetical protein
MADRRLRTFVRHARPMALVIALSCGLAQGHEVPARAVAVRWWGGQAVTLETFWGLRVAINPHSAPVAPPEDEPAPDVALFSAPVDARSLNASPARTGRLILSPTAAGEVVQGAFVLDREPESPTSSWSGHDAAKAPSEHAIRVWGVCSRGDASGGASQGAVVVEAEGVRLLYLWGDLRRFTEEELQRCGRIDVIAAPMGDDVGQSVARWREVSEQLRPRFVLPLPANAAALADGRVPLADLGSEFPGATRAVQPAGNTLAVSRRDESASPSSETRLALLNCRPWVPEGELASLWVAMDRACADSQSVFAPLSASQMSFRPSNGTHTPRWNVEHMLGRQLLFFTQIYAALDDQLAPLDLNPAQMPPDYRAAHPDWSGAEEARQMERANAYVRRFAYLLEGVDLSVKAPGSSWTLRRLLRQMDVHFHEHTANVRKKFELPEWPAR